MAKATAADLEKARKRIGPIERREMRLAFAMLSPTVAAVLLVVLIPVLANFWISVKPIELADLRAAQALVRERVQGEVAQPGDSRNHLPASSSVRAMRRSTRIVI